MSVVPTDSVATDGDTVIVPEPFAETETVTLGEEESAVSVPEPSTSRSS